MSERLTRARPTEKSRMLSPQCGPRSKHARKADSTSPQLEAHSNFASNSDAQPRAVAASRSARTAAAQASCAKLGKAETLSAQCDSMSLSETPPHPETRAASSVSAATCRITSSTPRRGCSRTSSPAEADDCSPSDAASPDRVNRDLDHDLDRECPAVRPGHARPAALARPRPCARRGRCAFAEDQPR